LPGPKFYPKVVLSLLKIYSAVTSFVSKAFSVVFVFLLVSYANSLRTLLEVFGFSLANANTNPKLLN